MFTAYVIVTVLTIVANAAVALADLVQVPQVLANMDEVGVPRSWLLPLALLKAAGALGLLLGLLGVRPIGLAAAIGLILFFIGALVAHVRARVFGTIGFPGAFLVLAVASAVLVRSA